MTSPPHAQMKSTVTFTTIWGFCATPQVEVKAQSPAMGVEGHIVSTLELLGDHARCPLAFAFPGPFP